MKGEYKEWLVFRDWRYLLVYTVDFVAHKMLGSWGNRIEFPGLCDLERRMFFKRWDSQEVVSESQDGGDIVRPHDHDCINPAGGDNREAIDRSGVFPADEQGQLL